jgi:hypothetical protein
MTLRKMLLACAIFLLLMSCAEIGAVARQQTAASAPSALAPGDARFRADIRAVEGLLPTISDRGAAQFFLAWLYAHLGEFPQTLSLLKECPLNEGFDPSGVARFESLSSNPEFRELVTQIHRRYPPVQRAHIAFTVAQKDLFPEGLAADAERHVFYMGSMHMKKIVAITDTGKVSDFVRPGLYDLMPVGGVHVNPADHSVWAATDPGAENRSEIVHFDARGKLLERFAAPGPGPHDLNDLVLRDSREIYVTDTFANQVYRFDCKTHRFSPLAFPRPIFYPNGITVSDDGNFLYVADMLGVIRVDLRSNEAQDVIVGNHYTLAGIDGLYWYRGGLVGVQYGAGAYRVMQWHLSVDGLHVTSAEFLEYRTPLVKDPTTGAIVGTNFYFISNTGISNLDGNDSIVDPQKLEPIHISMVPVN